MGANWGTVIQFTDLRLRLASVGGVVSSTLTRAGHLAPLAEGTSSATIDEVKDASKEILEGQNPGRAHLLRLGLKLGEAAFPRSVRQFLAAEAALNPIRIRISGDPLLTEVPWECSVVEGFGSANDGFLTLSGRISLTRDVELSQPTPLPSSDHPKVLVAWANPGSSRYPLLHFAEKEAASVVRALRSSECSSIQVDELPYASISSLLRSITERKPDVLHFIGHGDINPSGGIIVLEGGLPGTDAYLYAEDLASAIVTAGTSLVVLSGCLTSGSPQAIGTKLAAAGVPSVLAMSMPIQDAAAHQFARALYSSLAEGTQLEEALFEGRCAIAGMGRDWAAPQLMLSGDQPIVLAETGEAAFKWKSVEHKTNLSYDDRPFIGRVKERADLRRKIRDQGQRLVTITGPGGMGKTRLSKQVSAELAGEFPDGVWFVDCEALTGVQEITSGIAAAIPFAANAESRQALLDALSRRRMLLVLDCFENSVAQGALIEAMVEHAPGVHVLLTSRIVLGLPREHEYPLQPMNLAAKGGETADSITLFAEAAGHAIDGFEVNAKNRKVLRELCTSLEGVPLAIVLAAGRLRHMGLAELLKQIQEQPIATLRRRTGGIERHSNIESVVAGSFSLLPPAERHILCKIGLFVGSFTLADAAYVCDMSETELIAWLSDLRDHSLVQILRDELRTRYKLLDTVRDYISRLVVDPQLEGELALCRARHVQHYTNLTVEIGRLMSEGRWSAGTTMLMQDIGNIRSAIDTAELQKRDELISAMAGSIARRLFEAGLLTDFRKLADAAYLAAERLQTKSLRIQLLGLDGALASRHEDQTLCERLWQERVDLCRSIGDTEHCADALIDLAWHAFENGDKHQARLRIIEAFRLVRSAKDPAAISTVRVVQARLAFASSNSRLARHRAHQAESLLPLCIDRNGALFVYQNLVVLNRDLGELQKSVECTLHVLRLSIDRHQVMHAGWALLELAPMYEQTRRLDLAARCYLAAMKVHAEYATRLRTKAMNAFTQFKKRHEEPEVLTTLATLRNRSWQDVTAGLTST